jgi:hypothetical protein
MSKDKSKRKFGWGGRRPGAGRPEGSGEKVKISVSVDLENWENALSRWRKKASHLVDSLVAAYIDDGIVISGNNDT